MLINKFYNNISEYYSNNIVTNFSPSNGYRLRCEFGYYDNFYLMHKNGKKIYLETFENATTCIQELMPKILNQININESLKEKLFQINFRSNVNDDVMVSLIYHKKIDKNLIEIIKNISKNI